MQNVSSSDGKPALPLPFYYGLIPWAWKRITRWRDSYGRKAHLIRWQEFSLF